MNKEINVYSSQDLKIRLLVMSNSISFVEESTTKTQEKTSYSLNHYNISIKDIHSIKYGRFYETTKTQMNLLFFILSIFLLVGGIICIFYKVWGLMGILLFFSFICLLIGIISKKPSVTNSSHSLIIESENKILYSKKINIDSETILEIIKSIRDRQESSPIKNPSSSEE